MSTKFKYLGAITLIALVFSSAAVVAQTPVTIDSGDQVGYAGSVNGKHVVRDSIGVLYMIRMDSNVAGTRTLVLGASFDGGMSWGDIISSGINGPSTGESGSPLVGQVSMAIDDQDILHVMWACAGGGQQTQYYCSIDPGTLMVGPIVDLKAQVGASNSSSGAESGIIVDASGTVWCLCGSSSSYRCQLLKSDAPYAATGTFSSVGIISVGSGAQYPRLAVDAAGLVHCAYYNNTGTGNYRFRTYDPVAATWSGETDLGDLVPSNDYTGGLACDFLGNTHIVCNRDSYASTGNPTIVYIKRDSAGNFSAPITVTSATNSQYNGVGNQHTVDLACNEVTGDVYVMYRDFSNGGSLTVDYMANGAGSFSQLAQLGPANSGQHYYYAPRIRGTLYPASNNTGTDLHMTYREMWPAPFDFKFVSVTPGPPPVAKYPGNGTVARISTTVNGSTSSPITNEHTISSPLDQLTVTYDSVGGALDGTYFLSTVQLFTTGAVPAGILLPGDATGALILDLGSPLLAVVNSLGGVGTFNPVIGSTTFGFTFGPSLFGSNLSVIMTLICLDPANVGNPAGYGNAPAHEFILS